MRYPFPRRHILDSSKPKKFADDNLKFDENSRKFSKRVKTLWEKGKLLVTSNFCFSHSVFKRLEMQTRKIKGLFGKGLNLYKSLALSKLIAFADENFNVAEIMQFFFDGVENIVGKGKMLVTRIYSFSHNVFKRLFCRCRQVRHFCGGGITQKGSKWAEVDVNIGSFLL